MANTGIESIGRSINIADPGLDVGGGGIMSDSAVRREMQKNGVAGAGEMSDARAAATTFSDALRNSISEVNTAQTQADHAIKELISGRSKNIHETLLAVEKADSSLKLMMQVRNKILDAYKEVMRMQV